MLPAMKKIAAAAAAGLLAVTITACSSDDSTPAATSTPSTMPSEDVAFQEQNLVVVAGNVVTRVNNARDYDFTGEEADNGGVYDVGSFYDDLTPECKKKTTRSEFRKSFIDKIVPLIDDAQPERVTAEVDPAKHTAVAKVEQQSGRTLVMRFDVSGTSEDFACTDDGMIAITATGGSAPKSTTPTATATVTQTPPATETAPAAPATTSPNFPTEWDKDGDGLIDKDAPIGDTDCDNPECLLGG